jgi:hypothetical protein
MNKVEKSKLYEDRMAIWNAICETDQKHMKKVSIGSRSFNTVDAQYQIKKMTETFGPVGIGWGYDVEYDYPCYADVMMVVARVTVWHTLPENKFGPVAGCRTFISNAQVNGKPLVRRISDEEATKSAMTDALTKALSHIGCDADMFLGKYDGNKYEPGNNKNTKSNPLI